MKFAAATIGAGPRLFFGASIFQGIAGMARQVAKVQGTIPDDTPRPPIWIPQFPAHLAPGHFLAGGSAWPV
jgi:hypothetical protein